MKSVYSLGQRGLAIVAVATFFLAPSLARAEPIPGPQDKLVIQLVCDFLQRGHLSRPEINADLSRKLFPRFIKSLDPTKVFFLQSDVDEFKKEEAKLSDMLLQGDLSFPYAVYNRFLIRLEERVRLVDELIKVPQDFTVKEYLENDFDGVVFAQTDKDIRERWRKRLKFDLLLQRIGQKPVADAEARKKVVERYHGMLKRWKQVDNFDLMELYLSDLATCVDPHSSYMSPNTLDDFDIAMRLNLEGIGALLRSENGQILVAEIVPGGAAAADGRLKVNDQIIGVAQGDNQFVDVVDMKLREAVKLIRGPRATPVQLKIIQTGKIEPVIYDLTRRVIELKSQEARQTIVEQGKKADGKPYRIGVIDLPSFYVDMAAARAGKSNYKSATEDVRKILKDFASQGVDGVILDLRKNGGGSLSEALSLTGLFIDKGPVVQVKDSQGRVQQGDDPEPGVAYGGPLMVLVSRLSASASEILAGALQDYDRALIVGDTTTHGKGTVQTVIDLGRRLQGGESPKLGALKLTIQQFYRVNGDSTQNRGVSPDVVIPSLIEQVATGEKDLDNALAFDRVLPATHEDARMVPADLKAFLKTRSAQRVRNSAEFKKLLKTADLLKANKARKTVPLNEKELKEQFSKDDAEKTVADKLDPEGASPEGADKAPDNAVFKFPRNFMTNEILAIMEDFLEGKKSAGKGTITKDG